VNQASNQKILPKVETLEFVGYSCISYIYISISIYISLYIYNYIYIYILGIHHWNTLEYPIEVIILGKSFHWNTLEYTTELATESTSPKVVEVGLAMACAKHACRDEWGRCARQGIPTVVASTI
jgi:hypothetical protein